MTPTDIYLRALSGGQEVTEEDWKMETCCSHWPWCHCGLPSDRNLHSVTLVELNAAELDRLRDRELDAWSRHTFALALFTLGLESLKLPLTPDMERYSAELERDHRHSATGSWQRYRDCCEECLRREADGEPNLTLPTSTCSEV